MAPERARRALLALLLAATLGIAVELILLDHTEYAVQWVPVVLTFGGAVVVAWYLFRPEPRGRRAFRVTMALYALSGVAGLVLHFRGNLEFELEVRPGAAGLGLVWAALKGATPALAPGTMIVLGTLGLIASTLEED